MATLNRIPVSWQSWPGAPGVSVFYTFGGNLASNTAAIRSYFDAIKALLPTGLTIQVPGGGDTINDADGKINGAWTAGATPAVVTATGAGAYAGNAGAVQHWLTSTVVNSRRVRGRTFIVPLVATAYDTAGSITAAALTTLNTAAAGLLTAAGSDMRVWHRPTSFSQGSSAPVTGQSMPDLAVSLRSRRV